MFGKTTFRDIVGLVSRKGSHRLSSRAGDLHDRRMKRLDDLGVRHSSRRSGLLNEIPRNQRKVYEEAYKALKNSNKSWATDSEVQAILYGDKEMSRARSSEVIEIMRRAGVSGFRETDEITSGDVYSERVLGVLNKKDKMKLRSERKERIDRVLSKDARALETPDFGAQTPTAKSSPDSNIYSSMGRLTTPRYDVRDQAPPKKQILKDMYSESISPAVSADNQSKSSQRKNDIEQSDDDSDKSVPLSYDLEDL